MKEQQTSTNQNRSDAIPQTVFYLGWAMLLINMSFVMIFSLFPIYLKTIGQTQTTIGFIEGTAEAISQVMKLFSGILSDIFLRRKPLIVIGFGLMVISRPVMVSLSSIPGMALGRFIERLGNGAQGTARDALVGDIAPHNKRGQCFGLKRSLGTFGSILGGVLAYLAMKYSNSDFKKVFLLSIIPAIIAFLIVIIYVKEPSKKPLRNKNHGFNLIKIRNLGKSFGLLMLVNTVFMLSRPSEAFMGLHAHINFGLTYEFIPFIMIIFNIGYTLSSYPIGVLSDRTSRYNFLILGIMALIIASLIFYKASSINEFWVGVIMWGVQMGVTTNIFTSLIVDLVEKNLHGTAFGCYFLINAVCMFAADNYAGFISDKYNQSTAYLVSSIIGTLSLVVLMLVMRYIKNSKTE